MSESTPTTHDDASPVADSGRSAARKSPYVTLVVAVLEIIAAAIIVASIVQLPADQMDLDMKNLIGFAVVAGSIIFLLIWTLARSPLPVRTKALNFAIAGTLAATFLVSVRFEGFSGDMVPRFGCRFASKQDALLAELPNMNVADLAELLPAEASKESGTSDGDLIASSPAANNSLTELAAGPGDYPQFLGPDRHPAIPGARLATDWKTNPPRELWRREIGAGWSAFAVVGDFAVTQEQRGEHELTTAYDLTTGKVHWARGMPVRFESVLGGDGPRATPTIYDGRVYSLGATGILLCLELETGEPLWARDIVEENDAPQVSWGRSGSPLVVDDKVIVSAGGPDGRSLVAYHRETGSLLWSAGADRVSYASPALATLGGVRQVLIVNEARLVAHRLADGEILWSFDWPGSSDGDANTSQPVAVGGDRVFLSKGYGQGSALIAVSKNGEGSFSVQTLWRERARMKTKLTNVVVQDGYVYGLSGGILECIALETGAREWKRGRYGHGQIMLVGDVLLIVAEMGNVVAVAATPEAHRQLGSFKALEAKTWNNPALARGKYLLVRNHREAACYELPLREEKSEE